MHSEDRHGYHLRITKSRQLVIVIITIIMIIIMLFECRMYLALFC